MPLPSTLRQQIAVIAEQLGENHKAIGEHVDAISEIHAVTKQVAALLRASRFGSRGGIRVAFFFKLPEVWPSWQTVWEACQDDDRIDARLVLLPFIHDDPAQADRGRSFLVEHGFPFTDVTAYNLDDERPDVVFLQNPYDSTRPESGYGVDALVRRNIRIAYIPYGLEVGGGKANLDWQYNLNVQTNAWRVFVRSEKQRQMYGRYCIAGTAHVVVSGHPRTDRLARAVDSPAAQAFTDAAGERPIVLWCPHLTVGGEGWSTYDKYVDWLLAKFAATPDLVLLIRPHPLLFGRMKVLGLLPPGGEAELREKLTASPNILLDTGEDYLPAFAASDASWQMPAPFCLSICQPEGRFFTSKTLLALA